MGSATGRLPGAALETTAPRVAGQTLHVLGYSTRLLRVAAFETLQGNSKTNDSFPLLSIVLNLFSVGLQHALHPGGRYVL